MNLLRFVRLVKKFTLLGPSKWKLYIKIIFMTFINRRKVLKKEFKTVVTELGNLNKESTRIVEEEKYIVINTISKAVLRVSNNTPWVTNCMVQAITAKKLLNNQNIDSTIYLGVTKEENELKAHAWLRCGEVFVTGGNGAGFAIVNYFSGISKK
ncbi:lasso peptide biosynthesis B2 protein [Clostridium chrysemydis]|uniref:lasso peptide biosynthesis B2 protein n=1 Tax=Clostridium chrysemydis TaxID=2665504 RepID=UPI001EE526B2|nr:lasso peptide biosynthesis B2 protein [Clostridium chrysemydis]